MAPGARFEINVDNKAMSKIRDCIKDPSMYAFDLAQASICFEISYLLFILFFPPFIG